MAVSGPRQQPELENARKILELERRQGFQNRAVTTGLASFLADRRLLLILDQNGLTPR